MGIKDLFFGFFLDSRRKEKLDFLRRIPLFEDLKDRQLSHVLQHLYQKEYQSGEFLFEEGDIGRALFIVESGKVELTKKTPDGKSKSLAVVGPGSFFGEMALLEEMPRSASAAALEPSRLHLFYKSKLEAFLERDSEAGVVFMSKLSQVLSSRLRASTGKVSDGI